MQPARHPTAPRSARSSRRLALRLGVVAATLLRQAGLDHVQAQVHLRLAEPDQSRRFQLLSLAEPLGRAGVLSADELHELTTSLRTHLENPHTLVVPGIWFQAWGRKPAEA